MKPDAFRLDGRVAVVTGAGRGIGAGIAAAFAQAGADVVLAARTRQQLEVVAEQVRAIGRRALVVPCDLRALVEVPTVVQRTIAELGRLDILVNNAGGAPPQALLETTAADLERAFRFNVTAVFELTRHAVPHVLTSGHGCIISITSAMDHRPHAGSWSTEPSRPRWPT